jgi:tyrosine aminotransferase
MNNGIKVNAAWKVRASDGAMNTSNPIREIIETMNLAENPSKKVIPLSIGDPTIFGNLKPCPEILDAIHNANNKGQFYGYQTAAGYEGAREAVASYHYKSTGNKVKPQDVILTSGCSHAIDLCICVLARRGQNILIPRPGFPLYKTLTSVYGVKYKQYDLLADEDWSVDLKHLESLVDENTAAIVINNPSNPCGSVFNRQHLLEILQLAERNRLPIIADEIYDKFVFSPEYAPFISMAELSETVPILTCGGISKTCLIPGLRLGWIIINDKKNIFDASIRQGLSRLTQRLMGPNSIIQGALPEILNNVPEQFFTQTMEFIYKNALVCYERLKLIRGLKPYMPQGSMYLMVKFEPQTFPTINGDLDFTSKLMNEESVLVLPGSCFDFPNFFRICLTVPLSVMEEALNRIEKFCKRKSSEIY